MRHPTYPIYGAERSLAFYVAAEREHQDAPSTERALTALAALALLLVLVAIAIGGCA
jgi:hypothetical protein